jgi:hypothetical protein
MRYSIIFLSMLTSLSLAASKMPEGPPPPSLNEVMKKNASVSNTAKDRAEHNRQAIESGVDPDIKVIKKADATLEEYRHNNKLYMVKVTPKFGKPYYLYDEEVNGVMMHQEETPTAITPPQWTLFTW